MRVWYFRNILSICLVVIASYSSFAQDASRIYVEPTGWSIGTNFGMTDLWGDVGTNTFVDHYTNSKYTDKLAFMGGMFGRYTIHPCLAIRGALNYGTVFATDAWNFDKAVLSSSQGDDAYQRYARHQVAKSDIFESSLMFEFTPRRFNPESWRAHKKGQMYLGLGLGYFHFTPYSQSGLSTKWVATYDLHVEGQGFGAGYPPNYKQWQLCIPMTIGYRWDIGKHLNIGVEYCYRKTTTDYLDGVSGKVIDSKVYLKHLSASQASTASQIQDRGYLFGLQQPAQVGDLRGNASNKDAYSSINITFYYKVFVRTSEWWHSY
jgi:hypothetical protein